jgi:hypothetical protein
MAALPLRHSGIINVSIHATLRQSASSPMRSELAVGFIDRLSRGGPCSRWAMCSCTMLRNCWMRLLVIEGHSLQRLKLLPRA